MKKAIEIIAGEAAYANLKSFQELEQLNTTVRTYKEKIQEMNLRQDVKKNLLTIIDYIKRYSCKFFGVSWKRKRKIAKELNMSDRTVIRLCQRLEEFGFIKQHAMKRCTDMQQTSNAIVIQPVETKESVRQETAKMSDQKNNILLKQNQLLHNTYQPAASVTTYQRFKHFLSSTIGEEQKIISKLYGVYKANEAALLREGTVTKETFEQSAFYALKSAIMTTKKKRIHNLPGYFDGVIKRLFKPAIFKPETKSKPVREEMLPAWFVADQQEQEDTTADKEFLVEKEKLEVALRNRKRK